MPDYLDPDRVSRKFQSAPVAGKKRNLGSIDLDESEPVTYKGDFIGQMSDADLLDALASEKSTRDPAEDTTGYKFEPNRPARFTDQQIADMDPENPSSSKNPKNKVRQDFKTSEIKSLLDELNKAQASDKTKNKNSRRSAWAQIGEEAATVGIGGLEPSATRVPMPEKYSDSKAVIDRAKLSNELQTGEEKRQNPEDERELKDRLKTLELQQMMDRLNKTEAGKNNRQEDAQVQQKEVEATREGGRNLRTDKLVKAGLVGGANKQNTGAGAQAGRQAAEEEYRQGSRYYKRSGDGRHEYHAIGAVEDRQSHAADDQLKAYSKLKPAIAEMQALLQKDPTGAALWGSDVRSKLLTASMFGLEANVKYQGDGVMNGRDLDNAKQAMGDPKAFEQWIANNGPAHLSEASKIMDDQLDGVMKSLNYDAGPGTGPKQLSDLHKAAGSAAGSMQRPVAPADLEREYNWITGAGPAPSPGTPAQPSDVQPPAPSGGQRPMKKVIRNGRVVLVPGE